MGNHAIDELEQFKFWNRQLKLEGHTRIES